MKCLVIASSNKKNEQNVPRAFLLFVLGFSDLARLESVESIPDERIETIAIQPISAEQ